MEFVSKILFGLRNEDGWKGINGIAGSGAVGIDVGTVDDDGRCEGAEPNLASQRGDIGGVDVGKIFWKETEQFNISTSKDTSGF